MKKKWWIIIIGVVIVVVVALNFTTSTSNATKVNAEKVLLRDIVEKVSASGRIQPETKVNITAEITAEIISLPVKEGDRVNSGDLLIVLDTVQVRSDLDQAEYSRQELEARLEGAKSLLDQAREEFERQQQLYDNNLTSETAYKDSRYSFTNAQASYQATQALVRQARARYEKQLDNLSKAKLVAPMDGVVTYVDCEVGEIAPAQTAFTQGKTLMTISNLNVFEVEVEVDETEISKVKLNQEAEIEVDAFPDTTFKGRVVEIGNTAMIEGAGTQDQSTNFMVRVVFEETNVDIRPGMSATVDITTSRSAEALAVPFSSVVMRTFDLDSLEMARMNEGKEPEDNDGVQAAENNEAEADSAKLVADEDEREELRGAFVIRNGKARFVQIKTGIADQKYIQVTSGVEAGDSVISGPYRVLRDVKDGDAVEVTREFGRKQS